MSIDTTKDIPNNEAHRNQTEGHMAQQNTKAAGSNSKPVACIYVQEFINLSKSAERLHRMFQRKSIKGADQNAVFDGYWEVSRKASEHAGLAKEHGQLLMCFEGTTATQVAA
jgi:hypothetical protein